MLFVFISVQVSTWSGVFHDPSLWRKAMVQAQHIHADPASNEYLDQLIEHRGEIKEYVHLRLRCLEKLQENVTAMMQKLPPK